MTRTLSLDALNDRALLHQFGKLVRKDHEGKAALLRHIDAIDRRQLWAKLGHPSLFDFLVARYDMSESTAGKRIGAARSARRFPALFDMVARGELHLSAIHCLKAHLTAENHERVLAQAKHKTVRQVEQLVAHLAPQPDAPSILRALPSRVPSPPSPAPGVAAPAPITAAPAPAPTAPASAPPPTAVQAPKRSPDPAPLSPGRFKLQVTITQETRDRLKQLQDLLAHQIPNGDPATIVARAFEALLAQVLKQKARIVETPRARKSRSMRRVRSIPAAILREVWIRDEGRCTFLGEDGHRCNETRCLEFAHSKPWGKGGEHSAQNIVLRCRAHNAWEADRDYGAGFMARKRKPHTPAPCMKVRERVARYIVQAVHHEARPWATLSSGLLFEQWACPSNELLLRSRMDLRRLGRHSKGTKVPEVRSDERKAPHRRVQVRRCQR